MEGYTLEWCPEAESGKRGSTTAVTLEPSATQWRLEGPLVLPDTSYAVRLRAVNSVGESEWRYAVCWTVGEG